MTLDSKTRFCSLCTGVATRVVGKLYFCSAHKENAYEACKREKHSMLSQSAISNYIDVDAVRRRSRANATESGWL